MLATILVEGDLLTKSENTEQINAVTVEIESLETNVIVTVVGDFLTVNLGIDDSEEDVEEDNHW